MGTGGWVFKGLYSSYLSLARENLNDQRTFEAIAISAICLDVLLRHVIDGLLVHHEATLTGNQIQELKMLETNGLTAGTIIERLDKINVLERKLIAAFRGLNKIRNRLIHPVGAKGLKSGAIIPPLPSREVAEKVYRYLSLSVRLAGGETPEEEEAQQRSGISDIVKARKRRRRELTRQSRRR